MRVALNQNHLVLNEKLIKKSNSFARTFNLNDYARVEDIERILLKRDVSVEEKKKLLVRSLSESVLKAFSVNKGTFNKKTLDSLKKRLAGIRMIMAKLRSINYYLESSFLQEIHHPKIKLSNKRPRLKGRGNFASDELEALEYTTYKLIEKAVVLDKRLLSEFHHKQSKILREEKLEIRGLGPLFAKESELLEHLEAKLPPPKAVTMEFMKEPMFTHWVSRIFALLSFIEHACSKENAILGMLKKDKTARKMVDKKIRNLVHERSKLLKIMEEKAISMEEYRNDRDFKKELHNLTTTINL